MGKENRGTEVGNDVEEGEISDTASLEEISEEDFNKDEVMIVKETKPKEARVLTMKDLYSKYRISGGGYISGLYNLAWAQAVQNKPLNELFVEVEPEDNSKRSSPSSSVVSSANSSSKDEKRVVEKVVIDDSGDEMDVEKEEGELEEGEIDLDSEPVDKARAGVLNFGDGLEVESKDMDLKNRVKLIREALESVTIIEVEKSFNAVCSKLHNTFESLQEVVRHHNVPTKDALLQLLFTAVRVVYSVFCSMNNKLKEQNKDVCSRLVSLVNSHNPPVFSIDQMKEIEAMIPSVHSRNLSLSARSSETEKEAQFFGGVNMDNTVLIKSAGQDCTTINMLPAASESVVHHRLNMAVEGQAPKLGLSSVKSRGMLLPLLDLHKDHDLDSLPSPTRETAPSLPLQRVLTVGDETKSGFPTPKVALGKEDCRMHSYETDALKAVSSYQQKFGRNSIFMKNRLPSPTPSEESGDEDGDTGGEVSSSTNVGNSRTVNSPMLGLPIASPALSCPESCSTPGAIPPKNSPIVGSGSSSVVKASAKSRDPRLRFVNTDTNALDHNRRASPMVNNTPKVEPVGAMSLRKHKAVEDPTLNGPSQKRQRNVMDNSGVDQDVKPLVRSGGWLEDSEMIEPQTLTRNQLADNAGSDPRITDNGLNCSSTVNGKSNVLGGNEQILVARTSTTMGSDQIPVTSTGTTSLPDLLKDIAVNPTMLLNILKMGQQQRLALDTQQKLADSAKSVSHPPSSSSILGAVPVVNAPPQQSSGLSPKPAGISQVPSQVSTVDDMGRIRMKPRDPRRVLHNNTLQRSGALGSEQLKTNVTSQSTTLVTEENQSLHKQEGQSDMKPVPSQSLMPPDISLPFTKSLKNIADIVSVSRTTTVPPLVSPNMATQPVQTKSEGVDVEDQQTGTGSTSELGAAVPCPHSAWGDVEHLFEGYDEKQKAAIQRERARRIEEQKKMFAVRKLCLVLDLDHTLLNSAKFTEVDPVHDDILRKKEEQDREKSQRHLFRFPHMGMWTKLRPGIWNFLEKASKMYELHLYTMGNKLYATEMAKVLDPKGVLFNGRVISKGDDGDPFDGDERVPKSKDLEGVLGMESAVVIIDDSVRVWPHNKLNLIVVERYIYFPSSRRQFGLPGPSLLEIDHDERPEDGTLACSLAVIERIHQNFFTHHLLDEADVRNILASEQRKILAGCRIVFSRVFPVGEANPHLHPLWQTAEQFGAVCTNHIDEQVTHVVANSFGTDKVNWALSNGRFAVYPGWVEASALLYRRANEHDFAIKP